MSPIELELLQARIIDRYDPDYVVDVLRLTTAELVTAFADRLDLDDFSELDDNDEEDIE